MLTLDEYRKALDAVLITTDDFTYTVEERGASAVYTVCDDKGRAIGHFVFDADRQTVTTENKAAKLAEGLPLPDGTRHYPAECKRLARDFDYLCTLLNERLEARRLALEADATPEQPDRAKRGPTEKTRQRAMVFRELKDKHPEWSYDTVAMKAMERCTWLGEITGESVRNAYRAMGWEFEKSDRVR